MAELPKTLGLPRNESSEPKVSILLVDDNPANLFSLRAILEALDQNLVEACSGEEALRRVQSEEFAVVLLDVVMPGISGFETAKLLRGNDLSRHTPIIFLTAIDINRSHLEEGYALGAVDFLVKPLVPFILLAKVRGFIELYEVKQRARHEADQLRLLIHGTTDYAFFLLDPEGHVVTWNSGAERLKGYKAEEIIGQHFSHFYAPHAVATGWPRHELEVAQAEGRFENEGWQVRKDGSHFWANVVITALRDEQTRLRGFSKVTRDLTTRKQAEEALRQSEERFRLLVEGVSDYAIFLLDPEGIIASWNVGAERIKQYRAEEIIGQHFSRFYTQEAIDRGWPTHELKVARSEGRFEDEGWRIRKDGTQFWANVVITALRDETGYLQGFSKITRDMTERKRAEENTRRIAEEAAASRVAKRAEESARFLAAASAALASVVDYESTLQKVANLAVPYFADWSAVDVANDDGSLRRLAVAHQDPAQIQRTHELMRLYPPDPQAPSGSLAVFRTGQPEIVSEITDAMLIQGAKDERHLTLTRLLGLKSSICVPLFVSGNPLGVLSFATAESGRRYTDADLTLAKDLAQRAGVAIENTQLYQALQETDRRKDEFLATLAHELRNPLAPIRNALQILKIPRVDAETVERSRDMMERQVQHLVRLVDDLLDVSRVMRGKIDLRRESIEFATVVARAVETVQPLVDSQGHELSVLLPSESLLLDADPVRLAQVVGNLLTNAAKYTELNGRIWLTAKREGNEAVLRVRDNGIGLAPNMLPRIFELFVQVDHAATRSQGGLGIGLTLVKNLVEMHNGRVEARSEGLGKGTEFVVRLPISAREFDQPHDRAMESLAQSISPLGYRLLVVDDNQDAANSLAMLLRLQGHEVRVAFSGPAALEMTKDYSPDVVFLDIGMPAMDGYEVARRIRQQPRLEKVVLAALTGWGQQEDRRRTVAAGFDHHFVKPPELKVIESVLAALKSTKG